MHLQGRFRWQWQKCEDIDECAKDKCDSNADCANTLGSSSCTCGISYDGNGKKKIDINECNQRNICGVNEVCGYYYFKSLSNYHRIYS